MYSHNVSSKLSTMIFNQYYLLWEFLIYLLHICLCNYKKLRILPSKISCKDLSLYYIFFEIHLYYAKLSAISNLHLKLKDVYQRKPSADALIADVPSHSRSISTPQRLYGIFISGFAAVCLSVVNKTLREGFSKDLLMVPTNIKKKE